MTLVGIDDTDARTGMCTTYVASRLATRLREHEAATVGRLALLRCNPAIEHKTRGNGALCVDTDAAAETTIEHAAAVVDRLAEPEATPGIVVAESERRSIGTVETKADGDDPDVGMPATGMADDAVVALARSAVRDRVTVADAERVMDVAGYRSRGGRGRIGALAAIGALLGRRAGTAPFTDWTYERLAYRERERWDTPRTVDPDSVRAAAAAVDPPAVFDTIDRHTDEVVCVPHTPGPVLYGVRGDDRTAVERVAAGIESEPVAAAATFLTNQGTDAHVRPGTVGDAVDGRSYRIEGVVETAPETRRGGHVFLTVVAPETAPDDAGTDTEHETASAGATPATGRRSLACVAFEPTKRFRDHVRALRPGDRVSVVGELGDGTLKLEKFAVRALDRTRMVVPTCPDCERSMESAGRGQGYRCRDCDTTADGKRTERVERGLEPGWYEVPPAARRHVAKPLVRGGFDAPVHPE